MNRKLITMLILVLALLLAGCAQPKSPRIHPNAQMNTQMHKNNQMSRSKLQNSTKMQSATTNATHPIALFETANNCRMCHDGLKDSKGKDVSIVEGWYQTMMSHSSYDPFWQAKVSSEVARNPHLSAIIQEKCAECHMPMAYVQAKEDNKTTSILNDGFLNPDNPLHSLAMSGVSCTLCHQIENKNLGNKSSFSGGYIIDMTTPKPKRKIYGPFIPQRPFMMINTVRYTPAKSEHITKSELCAVCHTLYTPYVNSSGAVVGFLPEQTPFLELEHSSINKSCQDCHMPQTTGVRVSSMPRNPAMLKPRNIFFEHEFLGGNAFMLEIMGLHKGAIRDKNLLKRAVKLSIVKSADNGKNIEFVVKVENMAGHKFPTGFPSRRAWLHVKVVDSNGKTIFESGKCVNGKIVGVDGVKSYEPHHDVITKPSQVQIYESVMENTEGKVTYTLLRGAKYIKDNRLLPKGFDKKNCPPDIAVHGKALNDSNFVGGSDEVTYIVNTTNAKPPYKVYVNMFYQSVSYPFFENLKKDNTLLEQVFIKKFENNIANDTISISSINTTIN